jgi:hypothetical protein
MCTRSVILRATRTIRLSLAAVLVTSMVGGCRTTTPAPVAPSRATSSVLALPSAAQIACAGRAGLSDSGWNGRRNEVLGGAPIEGHGPSYARVDALSDQRIVNGRVYGNLRWRTRSVDVRGR